MEEKKEHKRSRFSLWLDKVDEKMEAKGKGHKILWQVFKFIFVSGIVTIVQIGLVNLLYFCMQGWTAPLPSFLGLVFSETTVGEGHSNWGYILPFFLSNLLANTLGYFLNKEKTFKSDSPLWHYIVYIALLLILIFFFTWIQGLIVNALLTTPVKVVAPTIASLVAGIGQAIILFPLQKFVLLREKKE